VKKYSVAATCFRTFRNGMDMPMGGYMSPFLAILLCCLVEMDFMESFPEGMIGGCLRYMDDVLGVMAINSAEDEAQARAWFDKVRGGYPKPLELNVEPESSRTEFLELCVISEGPRLTTMLYTSFMKALQSEKLFVPKLPATASGTTIAIRRSVCLGFVNRVVQGSGKPEMALLALACFRLEMVSAGWSFGLLKQAIADTVHKSKNFGEVEKRVLALMASVLS